MYISNLLFKPIHRKTTHKVRSKPEVGKMHIKWNKDETNLKWKNMQREEMITNTGCEETKRSQFRLIHSVGILVYVNTIR